MTLPTRLGTDLILEAVFECRFHSKAASSSAENLLANIYNKLDGVGSVERTPYAELPKHIRSSDSALKFVPLLQFEWKNTTILIGDENIVVACRKPYCGWKVFQERIIEVMSHCNGLDFIQSIERYSMKYVDLIENKYNMGQIDMTNIGINISNQPITTESFQLKVEKLSPNQEFKQIIQIVSNAELLLAGSSEELLNGLLIDIDTLKEGGASISEFIEQMPTLLEAIHTASKKEFFNIISDELLPLLEPQYD